MQFSKFKRKKTFEVKTIVEATKLIPQAKLSDLFWWGYIRVEIGPLFFNCFQMCFCLVNYPDQNNGLS